MPFLSTPQLQRRAERARFDDTMPVVLRFSDGQRASGRLKVVSVTGGLLSLPRPIRQGSVARVMFLTTAGSVLGTAEMLSPMSWELQPFRFVGLHNDDHSRLHTAIQTCLAQSRRENKQQMSDLDRVEKFRAW